MTDSSHRAPLEDSLAALAELARQQERKQSSWRSDRPRPTPWEETLIHEVARRRCRKQLDPAVELVKFGRFELSRCLGRGGFGIVFEAYDPKLDRRVALKLYLRERGPTAVKAIIREAKLLAKVSHPNVITVHDTGTHDGIAFFVMELIEGCRTGHDFACQNPRPSWEEIVDVCRPVAAALATAHDTDVVHNDLKPGNILIDEKGWPFVVDFGLAKHVPEAERESFWQRAGTLPYMAPEMLLGLGGDKLSDQWSFCAALWHMLNGVPPFDATTTTGLLEQIQRDEPEVLNDAVPQVVWDVLRVGLSADPRQRYPDMWTLLLELDRLRQAPVSASESTPPSEASSSSERDPDMHALLQELDKASASRPDPPDVHTLPGELGDLGRPSVLPSLAGPPKSRGNGFLVAVLVVCTATLASLATLWVSSERATPSASPSAATTRLADAPDRRREAMPPAPTSTDQSEPDSTSSRGGEPPATTVDDILAEIEQGAFEKAEKDWLEVWDYRQIARVPRYADAEKIAQALLDKATALKEQNPTQAFEAAKKAGQWGMAAAVNAGIEGGDPSVGQGIADDAADLREELRHGT